MDHDEWAYKFPLVLEEHQYDFIAVPGQIEMTLLPGHQMILHSSRDKSPGLLFAVSAFAFSQGPSASLSKAAAPGGELESLVQSLMRVELDVVATEADLQRRAQQLEKGGVGVALT